MADSPAPTTETGVVKLVVALLGFFATVGLCGMIYLLDRDKPGESIAILGTLTGAALGGLAGLLANTRSVNLSGLADLARDREEGLQMLANAQAGADRTQVPERPARSHVEYGNTNTGGPPGWGTVVFPQQPITPAPGGYRPTASATLTGMGAAPVNAADVPPTTIPPDAVAPTAQAAWQTFRDTTLQEQIDAAARREREAPGRRLDVYVTADGQAVGVAPGEVPPVGSVPITQPSVSNRAPAHPDLIPPAGAVPLYDADGVTFLGWEHPSPYPTLDDPAPSVTATITE